MKLPQPQPKYDQALAGRTNATIEQEDMRNRKKGADIELGQSEKLILRSPSGARWKLTVSDSGVVAASAA